MTKLELMLDTPWFRTERSADHMIYRVISKEKGWRTKTFKGESAWSDAQRYLNNNIVGTDAGDEYGYQVL